MASELTIPKEVADGITVATLTEWRNYLQSELDDHFHNGKWIHEEDIGLNREFIYCCDKLISAFTVQKV